MSLICSCECGLINFNLPYEPVEICDCHCNICQKDKTCSQQKFTSFAKYSSEAIDLKITSPLLKKITSSEFAVRYFCICCNNFICMYYYYSPNIWIVTDTFRFTTNNIEHYDLFKK